MCEQECLHRHTDSRLQSLQRHHQEANPNQFDLSRSDLSKSISNPLCLSFRSDENEDLILRVRDYLEKIVFSRNYLSIFNRIALACEEKDLAIQNRITSLHWITAPMLDTVVNENIPAAQQAVEKAMNSSVIGSIECLLHCFFL